MSTEMLQPKTRKKRRIMRTFKLNEVSAVDRAAQPAARMLIAKRDDTLTDEELEKAKAKADADKKKDAPKPGDDAKGEGKPPFAPKGKDEDDEDDDKKSSGKPAGDSGSQKGKKMTEKSADAVSADIQKRDDRIATLEAILELTPEQRAHYESLTVTKAAAFLNTDEDGRDEIVAKAEKTNPVVYTAKDGSEFRKNDDSRTIAMAKRLDAEMATSEALRKAHDEASFAKQADDTFGLVPGDAATKVAMIRKLSEIEDEAVRDGALEMLAKANEVYASSLNTLGVSDSQTIEKSSDPSALLGAAIKKCAEEMKVSEVDAARIVGSTPEGAALHSLIRQNRRNRAA